MSSVMRGNVRMALSGVRGAKWRSVLTMLGVIVGIVAVVTLVGIGEGVQRQIAGQLTHFGKDLITVRPGAATSGVKLAQPGAGDLLFGLGTSAGLTTADVQTAQQTTGIADVAPLGLAAGTVTVSGQTMSNTPIITTNYDLANLLKQPVANGGFWDQTEDDGDQAVIGSKAAIALFGAPVPLGHTLTFRGHNFIVGGIFAPFKAAPFAGGANFDNAVFLPYQKVAALTQNTSGIFVLLARPAHSVAVPATVAALTSSLRTAHGGQQDFSVLNSQQAQTQTNDSVRLLSEWIGAVAVVALIIGGVGITNVMLLSVTERMHEIGLRKAVGATAQQILAQFMIEATVLSLVGGFIAIGVSLALDGLLYAYTSFKPVISWRAMATATAVSLVIGVVSGTVPAIKAARKAPIDALRHE